MGVELDPSTELRGHARLLRIQRGIRAKLPERILLDLHQQRPLLDWGAIVLVFALLFINFGLIGSLSNPVLLGPLIIFQGVVLHWLGLLNHDLFVHRRFGGRLGRVISLAMTTPLIQPNTGYEKSHRRHHIHVVEADDTEGYKQDIDTLPKRLFFLTAPGVLLSHWGFFRTPRRERYLGVSRSDEPAHWRARLEDWLMIAFIVLVSVLAIFFPWPVLLGYVVPVIVVVPVLNTLRILIEHAEIEPGNPYSVATFYRTGPVSQIVFLWDAGDCHVVHHIFPNIPFYNFPKALKAIVPVLVQNGLVERHSFASLLRGWFVEVYGHRTFWPTAR